MQVKTLETVVAETTGAPYLEQYFGLWAMEEENFLHLHGVAQKFDLHVHMQTNAKEFAAAKDRGGSPSSYPTTGDGIAMIPITGMMMKQASSLSGGTSTVETRRKIRAAAEDPAVKGILLAIESPGGTVAGNFELANEITTAKAKKPIWAFCEDICCSAAYWAASQTDMILANKMAVIGSIGTYGVIYDSSAAAEKNGVKVHVVRAGEFKGAMTPGTPVTDSQLAEYQARIDEMNSVFLDAVQRGRKMPAEKVKALADGRAYLATEASQKGLIDGVQSLEETLSLFAASFAKSKGTKMENTQNSEPTKAAEALPKGPASFHEIKAACPGASAEFLMSQLDKKATVEQAQASYMEHLTTANSKLEQDLKASQAKEKEQADKAASTKAPGADPILSTGKENERRTEKSSGGDPLAEWVTRRKEMMAEEKMSMAEATKALAAADPDLYQSYLSAYNAKFERARATKK